MPPQRVHVLSDCRVRFTQRPAFEDDHELQPDYAAFGTTGEIWRFVIRKGIKLLIARDPRAPALATQTALKVVGKSIDELGVFCLLLRIQEMQVCAGRDEAGDGKGSTGVRAYIELQLFYTADAVDRSTA
jgi:hypothetical protein